MMKSKIKTVIEITDTQIRVFQSVKSSAGPILTFFDAKDISNLSENVIGKMLADMLKWKQLGEVIAIIPRQQAIVHAIVLPSHDTKELREMADLQAAQHIPYSREDVVMDVLPIVQTPDGFSRVFLIAVPKERISYYWNIFQAAKITPVKMTLSSIGIFQWYKTRMLPLDEVVMLINIDEQLSEICVGDQNKINALRVMVWGAADCRSKQFAEFVRQVDMTMTYYQREKLGREVASILIVSSLENDEGLCEQLSKEFGLPVGFKRVIRDVAMKKNLQWPRVVLDAGCSVTAGLGMALSDEKEHIDFIPQEVKEEQNLARTKQRLMRVGILAGMALLFIVGSLSVGFFQRRALLSASEKEIEKLKPAVSEYEKNSQKLEELKNAFAERVLFAQIISELERLIPSDMSLLNLSITSGKNLSIQGYTRDSQQINQLQKGMGDKGVFSNVTLDYVNKRTGDKGELNYFKITCQIKSGGGS